MRSLTVNRLTRYDIISFGCKVVVCILDDLGQRFPHGRDGFIEGNNISPSRITTDELSAQMLVKNNIPVEICQSIVATDAVITTLLRQLNIQLINISCSLFKLCSVLIGLRRITEIVGYPFGSSQHGQIENTGIDKRVGVYLVIISGGQVRNHTVFQHACLHLCHRVLHNRIIVLQILFVIRLFVVFQQLNHPRSGVAKQAAILIHSAALVVWIIVEHDAVIVLQVKVKNFTIGPRIIGKLHILFSVQFSKEFLIEGMRIDFLVHGAA